MSVKLIWATPNAEEVILYCARVSSNRQRSTDTRLLGYLVKHGHWSPFEMANMCVEITTTRAISAQLIRHRSFTFQEFSQRYAEATTIKTTEARLQDVKNRQNSIPMEYNDDAHSFWLMQKDIAELSMNYYQKALGLGIAKECARMLLPMSTETKLYMNGSLRSWIHYLKLRTDASTQHEHRLIAEQIQNLFVINFPIISKTLGY